MKNRRRFEKKIVEPFKASIRCGDCKGKVETERVDVFEDDTGCPLIVVARWRCVCGAAGMAGLGEPEVVADFMEFAQAEFPGVVSGWSVSDDPMI